MTVSADKQYSTKNEHAAGPHLLASSSFLDFLPPLFWLSKNEISLSVSFLSLSFFLSFLFRLYPLILLISVHVVAKVIAALPFTPGHECVGEIVGKHADVGEEYRLGDRAACENHYFCGSCYQCTHGETHIYCHLRF